jgi:hypothetical protein
MRLEWPPLRERRAAGSAGLHGEHLRLSEARQIASNRAKERHALPFEAKSGKKLEVCTYVFQSGFALWQLRKFLPDVVAIQFRPAL